MILQTWVCATAALLVLMWFISLSILFFATEDLSVFYTCILCSWLNWKPLKTNILKMEALVEEEDFSVFGFSTILGWIPVFWDTYGLCGRQESSFTSSKRQYLINLNMYVCVYIYVHIRAVFPAVGSAVGGSSVSCWAGRLFLLSQQLVDKTSLWPFKSSGCISLNKDSSIPCDCLQSSPTWQSCNSEMKAWINRINV